MYEIAGVFTNGIRAPESVKTAKTQAFRKVGWTEESLVLTAKVIVILI